MQCNGTFGNWFRRRVCIHRRRSCLGALIWEATAPYMYLRARHDARRTGRPHVDSQNSFYPGDVDSLEALKPGQGGVPRDGLNRLAACRDLGGKLHIRTAVCTHLGCHLNWNSTEQCWDCPCHGSQFAPDGVVLNGPAVSLLAQVESPAREARQKA